MHPAWWFAIGAVGMVALIIWLGFKLVSAPDDEEEDPYDAGWDDDDYWSSDNPTPLPPDVPNPYPAAAAYKKAMR